MALVSFSCITVLISPFSPWLNGASMSSEASSTSCPVLKGRLSDFHLVYDLTQVVKDIFYP